MQQETSPIKWMTLKTGLLRDVRNPWPILPRPTEKSFELVMRCPSARSPSPATRTRNQFTPNQVRALQIPTRHNCVQARLLPSARNPRLRAACLALPNFAAGEAGPDMWSPALTARRQTLDTLNQAGIPQVSVKQSFEITKGSQDARNLVPMR